MPLKTSNQPNTPVLWKAASGFSETALSQTALEMAQQIQLLDRILLEGPMGVGKTTFARSLLQGLHIQQPPEGSPSFAIAHEYESPRGNVVHIDFYRIRAVEEIEDAGIPAYYWEREAIVISEWLSGWEEFEREVITTGRVWRVNLDFDPNMPQELRTLQITLTEPSKAHTV